MGKGVEINEKNLKIIEIRYLIIGENRWKK